MGCKLEFVLQKLWVDCLESNKYSRKLAKKAHQCNEYQGSNEVWDFRVKDRINNNCR